MTEKQEIDRDVFTFCVQAFADAETLAALGKLGEKLKADAGVNEATKAALRDEYGRNVKRLRAKKHEKKIADDGGDF